MSAIRLANTDPDDIPTPPTDRTYVFLDLAGTLSVKDDSGAVRVIIVAQTGSDDPVGVSLPGAVGSLYVRVFDDPTSTSVWYVKTAPEDGTWSPLAFAPS